jgi:hypothetical protein
MKTNKIAHFVYFETMLCSNDFLVRWQRYHSSANINAEVILQESKAGDVFMYIAKHCCNSDEFQFAFTKASKSTRAKQTEIKKVQLGGYSIIQQQNTGNAKEDEYKLFIFLDDKHTNISAYQQVQSSSKLNIYQAYFENCSYAYILEYFIKQADIVQFKENLQQFNTTASPVYKEFKEM